MRGVNEAGRVEIQTVSAGPGGVGLPGFTVAGERWRGAPTGRPSTS